MLDWLFPKEEPAQPGADHSSHGIGIESTVSAIVPPTNNGDGRVLPPAEQVTALQAGGNRRETKNGGTKMKEGEDKEPQTYDVSEARSYSRRDFLKIAGVAGRSWGWAQAWVGCSVVRRHHNDDGGSHYHDGSGHNSGLYHHRAGSTTTVSAVQTGREVKIGFVTPLTGGLASFGVPDSYCVSRAKEAIGTGILCGDGQMHPVTILTSDSQSDDNRAAQVTGDLINNSKVDMIVAASTPDTVVPVADQARLPGCPASPVTAPGSRTWAPAPRAT